MLLFACSECQQVCDGFDALETHLTVVHLTYTPYRCPHCEDMFAPTESKLLGHILKYHPTLDAEVMVKYNSSFERSQSLTAILEKSILQGPVNSRPTNNAAPDTTVAVPPQTTAAVTPEFITTPPLKTEEIVDSTHCESEFTPPNTTMMETDSLPTEVSPPTTTEESSRNEMPPPEPKHKKSMRENCDSNLEVFEDCSDADNDHVKAKRSRRIPSIVDPALEAEDTTSDASGMEIDSPSVEENIKSKKPPPPQSHNDQWTEALKRAKTVWVESEEGTKPIDSIVVCDLAWFLLRRIIPENVELAELQICKIPQKNFGGLESLHNKFSPVVISVLKFAITEFETVAKQRADPKLITTVTAALDNKVKTLRKNVKAKTPTRIMLTIDPEVRSLADSVLHLKRLFEKYEVPLNTSDAQAAFGVMLLRYVVQPSQFATLKVYQKEERNAAIIHAILDAIIKETNVVDKTENLKTRNALLKKLGNYVNGRVARRSSAPGGDRRRSTNAARNHLSNLSMNISMADQSTLMPGGEDSNDGFNNEDSRL